MTAPSVPVSQESPKAGQPEALSQREQNWIEDINYLSEQYKAIHLDPFYFCTEEAFHWKISQLITKIPDLTDSDMSFEITKIMAEMGDPHTLVVDNIFIYDRCFPVGIQYFGEKAYLRYYLEGYDQFAPYLLREIVGVNGVDMTYLRRKAESLLYPTNSWFSKEIFPYSYFMPSFFDWAGCDYQEGYTLQILNEKQEVESVTLPAISYEEYRELVSKEAVIWPENWGSLHYMKKGNWADYFEVENGSYIYMCFSDMTARYAGPYQKLVWETGDIIAEHPDCGTLVIDLRFHPGGDGDMLRYFLENIELLRPDSIERTYVLIGGYSASAATRCAAFFKNELDAVLVGEPMGQFPSSFNRPLENEIILPNSRITVAVSTGWVDGPSLVEKPLVDEYYDQDGKLYEWENTVLPDVFVCQDIEDIRQGKDSVIERILKQ